MKRSIKIALILLMVPWQASVFAQDVFPKDYTLQDSFKPDDLIALVQGFTPSRPEE